MKGTSILSKLEDKAVKDEELVAEATNNQKALNLLLNGISSVNPKVKYRSAKILRRVSENNPEALYSSWDFFAKLLESKNNIIRWNAIDTIANLTKVDSQNKFDGVFKKFQSDLLCEGSLITAAHVVSGMATIVRARPDFEPVITKKLLKVGKVPVPTGECRNILIGHAIAAFDAYFDQIKDKDEVALFVKRQINNPRRGTKTKAEKLLKKLEKR